MMKMRIHRDWKQRYPSLDWRQRRWQCGLASYLGIDLILADDLPDDTWHLVKLDESGAEVKRWIVRVGMGGFVWTVGRLR